MVSGTRRPLGFEVRGAESIREDDHHPRGTPRALRRVPRRLHDRFVDACLAVLCGVGQLKRVLESVDIVGGSRESCELSREAIQGNRDVVADLLEDAVSNRMDVQQSPAHHAVADVEKKDDLNGHGPVARRVLTRAGRPLDERDFPGLPVLKQFEGFRSESAHGFFLLVDVQRHDHKARLRGDDQAGVFNRIRRLFRVRLPAEDRRQHEACQESSEHVPAQFISDQTSPAAVPEVPFAPRPLFSGH